MGDLISRRIWNGQIDAISKGDTYCLRGLRGRLHGHRKATLRAHLHFLPVAESRSAPFILLVNAALIAPGSGIYSRAIVRGRINRDLRFLRVAPGN